MHNFVLKNIVFYLIACITTSSSSERDEFPKINDIFKSLSEDPSEETITKPPDVVVRNIDINLETLNMSNFREKMEGYSKALSSNSTDDNNMLVKQFNSRRLAWAGSWADWKRASKVVLHTKLYDMMLQTIYMARHKIKQIENDPYYNPTETSYRIAFLYRKLLRLNRRVMDAYTTMKRNRGRRWPLGRFLTLHHRVAKLHMDFLYLWWVMVRLNERYEYRHGIPNTTPRPGLYYYPP